MLGLFCYLLENSRQPISREKLMSLFWAESPESQARYNLRYALWNIRKLYRGKGEDFDLLHTTRTTCQLNPELDVFVDSQEFLRLTGIEESSHRPRSLKRALDLYKGPFLEGFALKNLPEWEEWLYHRRETLHEAFVAAAMELGNHHLHHDDPQGAAVIFKRALFLVNDLEPAHEGLIRAYADQGRAAAALRQFGKYESIMEREYGAPPNQAIAEIAQALQENTYTRTPQETGQRPALVETPEDAEELEDLREGDQASAAQGDEPAPVGAGELSPRASSRLPDSGTAFVGRSDELAHFDEIIRDVSAGNGQVLIISGEMGIGKSRLVEEFFHRVPEEYFIGYTEIPELQPTVVLEPLVPVIESIGDDKRLPDDLKHQLDDLLARIDENLQAGDTEEEGRILAALRKWITAVASIHPLLIAIDDLHWSGEAILNAFATIAQDAKKLPLLVVGIFRTFEEQSEDAIASSLISVARTGRLRRIKLASLSEDETIDLIVAKASEVAGKLDAESLKLIGSYSAGIPLYAVELANFLREGNLDFLASPRLFDEPDFEGAAEEALIPPLMKKIASLRLNPLAPEQLELIRLASLVLGDFSLELIQELIEQEEERVEEMLIDLEHRNILHHIEKKGALLFSFNHQMIKLAIADTVDTLERRRFFRRIRDAVEKTGEAVSNEAMAYYLYQSGDQDAAIPYLISSSQQRLSFGDPNRALRYSRAAIPLALEKLAENPEKMIDAVLQHGADLFSHGQVEEAVDLYTEAIRRLEGAEEPEGKKSLRDRRQQLMAFLGKQQLTDGEEMSPLALVTTKRALANVRLRIGDVPGGRKLLDEVEAMVEVMPNTEAALRETGMLHRSRARLEVMEGHLDQAVVYLENALQLLREHGTAVELAEVSLDLTRIHRKRGELGKARELLKSAMDAMPQRVGKELELYYRHEAGMLAYESDKPGEAEDHLIVALNLAREHRGVLTSVPELILDFARVLERRGETDLAKQILEKLNASDKKLEDTDLLAELFNDLESAGFSTS